MINRAIATWLLAAMFLFPAATALPADDNIESVVGLLELVLEIDSATAEQCLATLSTKAHQGELSAAQLAKLRERLGKSLAPQLAAAEGTPLRLEAALLAIAWKDETAATHVRAAALERGRPTEQRLRAAAALVAVGDPQFIERLGDALADRQESLDLRSGLLAAAARLDHPRVATSVLSAYPQVEPELQTRIVDLLTQRAPWARALLGAIERKEIPQTAVGVHQVLRLQATSDMELAAQVRKLFGIVRAERNPAREKVVAEMRELFVRTKTDPHRGAALYQRLCAQCHKLHGQGADVGPDITANGRASFDQLLSNVFDPSLVIGSGYQARTVITADGRTLSGLPVEENEGRIVLKMPGGKLETIPRSEVEEVVVSPLSLMPEGIEAQYTGQELADLIDFLSLDRPPTDPEARYIPGTPSR